MSLSQPFVRIEQMVTSEEIDALLRVVAEMLNSRFESASDAHGRFVGLSVVDGILERVSKALNLSLVQIRTYRVYAAPRDRAAWHRDGSLLNATNTLNVWVPLLQRVERNSSLLIARQAYSAYSVVATATSGTFALSKYDRSWCVVDDIAEVTTQVGDCVVFDSYHFHSTSPKTAERLGLVFKCANGPTLNRRSPVQRFFSTSDLPYQERLQASPGVHEWMATRPCDVLIDEDWRGLPVPIHAPDTPFARLPLRDWFFSDFLLREHELVADYVRGLARHPVYDAPYGFEGHDDEVSRFLRAAF